MRAFAAVLGVLALGACTRDSDGGASRDVDADSKQQPQRKPAPGKSAITCKNDLDCRTCATERECGCQFAPVDGECPETIDACFADPCGMMVASCWEGTCRMRQGSAMPCSSDVDCEVRAEPCDCDLYPSLASAPPPERACVGRACEGRPDPADWTARCDPSSQRCVLEPRPA